MQILVCCSSRCSNRITLLPATDLKLGDVVLDESFFNIKRCGFIEFTKLESTFNDSKIGIAVGLPTVSADMDLLKAMVFFAGTSKMENPFECYFFRKRVLSYM